MAQWDAPAGQEDADWVGSTWGIFVWSPTLQQGIRFVCGTDFDPHGSPPSFPILQGAVEGLDSPVTDVTVEESARLDGGTVTQIRTTSRELWWPVFFEGADLAELSRFRDRWRRISNPRAGDVRIYVVQPDGSSRYINARYKPEKITWDKGEYSHDGWQSLGLRFVATDPWWHSGDPDAPIATFLLPASGQKPFFPILPLKLQSSVAGGTQWAVVPGDVPTYPRFVIQGPAGSVTAEMSGLSWTLDKPIDPGMTVTVDTSPYRTAFTVQGQDGTEWWRYMTSGSSLFPLDPSNPGAGLTVTLQGATADSRAAVYSIANWEAAY